MGRRNSWNVGGTPSGTNLYTFPAAADTLVGRDSTDVLTNKTLTTPTISSTGFANANHAHTGSTSGGTLAIAATPFLLVSAVNGDYTNNSTFGTFLTPTGLSLTLSADKAYLISVVGNCTVTGTAGTQWQILSAHAGTMTICPFEFATVAASAWTVNTTSGSGNNTGTIMTTATQRAFRWMFTVVMDSTGGTLEVQINKVTSGSIVVGSGSSITAIQTL